MITRPALRGQPPRDRSRWLGCWMQETGVAGGYGAALNASARSGSGVSGRGGPGTFASTWCAHGRICWEQIRSAGDGMARIEGEIVIGRPVNVVFDYVADQGNEPQYNLRMVRAEKITAGPVGKGTRFRPAAASLGRTAEMLIECTGYNRPALFASTTMMQPQATGMSAAARRTPHCPSRERPPRPTSPLLSRRRGTSICPTSISTTKTWCRRGSGSASTWVHPAGTAPASHRAWISRTREAPQCRSGRSQS